MIPQHVSDDGKIILTPAIPGDSYDVSTDDVRTTAAAARIEDQSSFVLQQLVANIGSVMLPSPCGPRMFQNTTDDHVIVGPVSQQRRAPPVKRTYAKFGSTDDAIAHKPFVPSKHIMKIEHQPMNQRIPPPKKGSDSKETREQMLYYVQYILHQLQAAHAQLFSDFYVDGEVITIIFDSLINVSFMYDFRLYYAGDWMLNDCNMHNSFHFVHWSDFDFAVINMLMHARRTLTDVFKFDLVPCSWHDGHGILYFVESPQIQSSDSDDSGASEDSDAVESDAIDDNRGRRRQSSKSTKIDKHARTGASKHSDRSSKGAPSASVSKKHQQQHHRSHRTSGARGKKQIESAVDDDDAEVVSDDTTDGDVETSDDERSTMSNVIDTDMVASSSSSRRTHKSSRSGDKTKRKH